jgi:iron complex transport system substrate-binding protein
MKAILAFIFLACMISSFMSAMASDSTLKIFGNANMDETIDEDDIEYVQAIINGKKESTELADANYDGKIDERDTAQIGQILEGTEEQLTVIDDTLTDAYPHGRPVTVKKPVKGIVGLNSNVPEALRILGSGDTLIGISKTTASRKAFFSEISELPVAAEDVEKIISLDPDLVLGYGGTMTYSSADIDSKLNGTGIQLVRLDFNRPDTFAMDISRLGYILNKRNRAAEFIEFYHQCMDPIKEMTQNLSYSQKPSVYIELWNPYRTVRNGTELDAVIMSSGGINIASNLTGDYPTVEGEWVIDQNPDFIISIMFNDDGYELDDTGKMGAIRDEIINRTGFSNITAVKNGNVFVIDRNIGFLRHFVGVSYLSKLFYPDLFPKLNPDEINKKYLEEFQGIPYKGFYIFPPLEGN